MNKQKNILLKASNDFIIVPVRNIVYCKAWDCWSVLFLNDGSSETVPYTLKAIQEKLQEQNFIRTHRSYLVNPLYINKIIGNYEMILASGFKIPVSRRNKSMLKNEIINEYA